MNLKFERGGFVLGLVVGLLIGLAVALGVALFITKAPVPFVNKVPQRTAEQDQAEAQRNRNWDPNAPLAGKNAAKAASGAVITASAPDAGAVASPSAAASRTPLAPARDPAAILSGANPPASPAPAVAPAASVAQRSTTVAGDPFVYFVQVGAYANADEAEQQRARLALAGFAAKVTEREQSGRAVHRVRVGPLDRREDAEAQQARLTEAGLDARLVRVEKSNP